MGDTSLTDQVLKQIMSGCRAQARKDATKELKDLRSENKHLLSERKKLRAEVAVLSKGARSIATREKNILLAASKVNRSIETIKKLKDMKIKNVIYDGTGWDTLQRESRAVREVKKMVKR